MGPILLNAMVGGIALGGVLAIGAAWSRHLRCPGQLPHLGVGAVAAVGAAAAARTADLGAPGAALAAGALAGALAGLIVVGIDGLGQGRPRDGWGMLGPDLAVLGALVATASLFAPRTAATLSLGPLGVVPPSASAAGGCVILAGAAVTVLGRLSRRSVVTAALVGALCGAAAALASGVVGPVVGPVLVASPDAVGLALRVAAAALIARHDVVDAAGAGLGLGIAEGLVRVLAPLGTTALAPTVLALLVGVALVARRDAAPAGSGR